jgi:hypothetical protein
VVEPVRLESIRQKQSFERDTTTVEKTYHIVDRDEKTAAASLEQFAKSNGQFLLPLLELVTQARIAVDDLPLFRLGALPTKLPLIILPRASVPN